MSQINSLLDQRMKKQASNRKMSQLANESVSGNLTSFSGVFRIIELSLHEKEALKEILNQYAPDEEQDLKHDLSHLISLTSEVKAINNQAALLHGERIKRAHQILIRYREGAFTAWLFAAYGNRQTPYNFMQYYDFCENMPKQLRPQIEMMPRQAIYVLASREGHLDKKAAIVEQYQGETKAEMLAKIRQIFPLPQSDRRKQNSGKMIIQQFEEILRLAKESSHEWTSSQKNQILQLSQQLQHLIGRSS